MSYGRKDGGCAHTQCPTWPNANAIGQSPLSGWGISPHRGTPAKGPGERYTPSEPDDDGPVPRSPETIEQVKDKSWRRLLGEFTVIFVSIVLALVADDWRESRSEREEGLDALELILADLESDARGYQHFQERLGEQAQSAADLLQHAEHGSAPGEIVASYGGVVLYYNFEVGAAAYRGLAGSGGLRLIASDTVVAALASYYDGSVAYMEGLRLTMERDADAVALAGQRHFLRLPVRDEEGNFAVERGWGFRLASTPAEIQADRAFLSSVGAAGASANWLALRIGDLMLERNAATTRYVREYLERMGRNTTESIGGR